MDMIGQQRKLFEELWQLDPGVIEDGVSDEAQYTSAAYRIMYVLKEVNGGSGWSLCDHLRSGGRDREHDPTWDNIARWSEGDFQLAGRIAVGTDGKGLSEQKSEDPAPDLCGQCEKDFRKLCFRQQAGVCGCTGQWRNLEKAAGTLCA
ncbi:hypothetical protein RJD28_11810 [Oscillospiraceae bacterium NTUH-002-81]|nr:hypothetical protein RJD28_11810 [Oscillospiraceae bacterium NTUH-002-81]